MISTSSRGDGPSPSHKQAVSQPAASRVVPKPVPRSQVEDARGYQIEQLRRRFSPRESSLDNGSTSLAFNLKPSDPDFPFELDHLECDVCVPAVYPRAPPTLRVRNKGIPRGFAINIERGWDKLVQEKAGATLLALTNALDKNLESLLSEQKAETVKVTIFKDARHLDGGAGTAPAAEVSKPAAPPRPYIPDESFSKQDILEAKARRAQEVRQLEARMGRDPLYSRSSDGIVYSLPMEPRRRSELPQGLQAVRSLQLIVPLLYPLQEVRILLNEVDSRDAEGVEELFVKKAAEQKQMTLMSHINHLTQNLQALARQAPAPVVPTPTSLPVPQMSAQGAGGEKAAHVSTLDDAKSHIHIIPRPPEWSSGVDPDGSDEDSDDSDEDEDGGAAVEPEAVSQQPAGTRRTAERGTSLSFPTIELYGIELLQISVLSISVKCERCKTVNDIAGLTGKAEKAERCKKCGTDFAIGFRPEPVHQNSTRAGFIDTAGCTVADMLPSTFVPTCAKCSTASQGLVSVRGETTTNVCRECHGRFTFKMPEVKLLAYGPGSGALPPTSGPRRRQEKLGLQAGEALPGRGACPHYRRSYRWFRFSCCGKVHACDRCHDEAESHVNEWANRMICGWCSREQRYSPESCLFCGRSVIGKRGKGFWEGGKGTRNKTLMRRGDKRKYRRVGGGESKKPGDNL